MILVRVHMDAYGWDKGLLLDTVIDRLAFAYIGS
jgi:hypothetical protein